YDARFGKAFAWDVDLLSGYRSSLLTNRSPKPSPRFFARFFPTMAEVLGVSPPNPATPAGRREARARKPAPHETVHERRRAEAVLPAHYGVSCDWPDGPRPLYAPWSARRKDPFQSLLCGQRSLRDSQDHP